MVRINSIGRLVIGVWTLTIATSVMAENATRSVREPSPRPPITCTVNLERVHKSQCTSRTMVVRICQRGPVIVRVTQQCMGG